MRVVFAFDGAARAAQRDLARARTHLLRAWVVWDVVSLVGVDRARERSIASVAVTRTPVSLSAVTDGVVIGDQTGLQF